MGSDLITSGVIVVNAMLYGGDIIIDCRCFALDLLDPSYSNIDLELCNLLHFLSALYIMYLRRCSIQRTLFYGWNTEVAKLEKAERRYAWIKRQLRSNEEVWSIFPPSWRVAHTLCMQFCKVTR